jgi:hypothetical protein
MRTGSITAPWIGRAGPEPLPAAFPMRAGGPGEGSGSCGGIETPNETLGSLAHKAYLSKQFRKCVSFGPVSRGFSSPGLQPSSSYPSFLARGKQYRAVFEPAGSSHSVSVLPVRLGAGSSHSVSVTEVRIDATPGRRCTRRRPLLTSHSGPSNPRLRRVLDMTGAGVLPRWGRTPRSRMRRKAVVTCIPNQPGRCSSSWRCSS